MEKEEGEAIKYRIIQMKRIQHKATGKSSKSRVYTGVVLNYSRNLVNDSGNSETKHGRKRKAR